MHLALQFSHCLCEEPSSASNMKQNCFVVTHKSNLTRWQYVLGLWGEPEQAVARRGKKQQSGLLLVLHLRNQGRWSMCKCVRTHLSYSDLWRLSSSLAWPHPVQRSVAT